MVVDSSRFLEEALGMGRLDYDGVAFKVYAVSAIFVSVFRDHELDYFRDDPRVKIHQRKWELLYYS